MKKQLVVFDEHHVLHDIKHFLPAQAPLKDFVHHNTLHAFQHLKFYQAIRNASEIFGYKVSLSLGEFRTLFEENRIREDILENVLIENKGISQLAKWKERLLSKTYNDHHLPRIGYVRSYWKKSYHLDLDSVVHPKLFRILCSYLDQGIAIWSFPVRNQGFLNAIIEMERNSFTSFFKTPRAKKLLLNTQPQITDLLKILIGDEALFEHYLYDQQFAHPGWSGMISAVETQPETLLDTKEVSLHDLIILELLLEIDAIDAQFGTDWTPLGNKIGHKPTALFAEVEETELSEVLRLWQTAFEWTYYDQVLAGLQMEKVGAKKAGPKTFQAMFCIDDRECSIRRHFETQDPHCETFGTPGFFGVEFYYQPEDGKFYTKVCPVPVKPKFLVKEIGSTNKRPKDVHFTKHSHSFYGGWLISQTLGFWSAMKLFINIFRPSMSPATASSLKHMDRFSKLTIDYERLKEQENGLQVGFMLDEMVQRVEGLLKSIGLVKDFAPIVYAIGHGSSSVNNPHYAAYDCGACSGRAGSVNARVISSMANNPQVREELRKRGIDIPDTTQFLGGLHDTTRDDIIFFDEESLSPANLAQHKKNLIAIDKATDFNAKERSRRFESIDTTQNEVKIHELIRQRSVSLFEPRPELNHATNALCIIGKRELSKGLFLDRRSFLNSYDYTIDPDGNALFSILKAAAPVCGGINLEYYFSRVDNQKLGAGTKLPHNVMGLFGVANGIDGDLRPGLPSQMIEVHDPVRMLIIVEHYNEVVLKTIQKAQETYEWFENDWLNLVTVHPTTKALSVFKNGTFEPYTPITKSLETVNDIMPLIESHQTNFPVYLINS